MLSWEKFDTQANIRSLGTENGEGGQSFGQFAIESILIRVFDEITRLVCSRM